MAGGTCSRVKTANLSTIYLSLIRSSLGQRDRQTDSVAKILWPVGELIWTIAIRREVQFAVARRSFSQQKPVDFYKFLSLFLRQAASRQKSFPHNHKIRGQFNLRKTYSEILLYIRRVGKWNGFQTSFENIKHVPLVKIPRPASWLCGYYDNNEIESGLWK